MYNLLQNNTFFSVNYTPLPIKQQDNNSEFTQMSFINDDIIFIIYSKSN